MSGIAGIIRLDGAPVANSDIEAMLAPMQRRGPDRQSATCVGTLLDRLCHRVEIVQIAGESWRLKESMERSARPRTRPPHNPT